MKIIVPHGVESPAACFAGADDSSIVPVALWKYVNIPFELLRFFVNGGAKLFQEGPSRRIDDGVDRIEAKGINVEVGNPLQGIFDEIAANLVAHATVEIDGFAPRRPVQIREIRTEVRQVISLGAEVVVNDIEHHGDSLLMARVDKFLERGRAAVRRLDRIGIDAVVSPVTVSGKLGHGHQLDGRNAKVFQGWQSGE